MCTNYSGAKSKKAMAIMVRSPLKPVAPPAPGDTQAPLVQRLGWLALMMVCGLVTVAVVAYGLRKLLFLNI